MQSLLLFLKEYWTQIIFIVGVFVAFITQILDSRAATKCSLRNDILDIYEKCKETRTITLYQLEAVELSYTLYQKYKGNSFVQSIVEEMRTFTRI